jgi:glycosyltransferase involved in cell wall biosynthesis
MTAATRAKATTRKAVWEVPHSAHLGLTPLIPIPMSTQSRRPDAARRVFLAAVGDVNSPATWSGIPFHFLCAARRRGLIDVGLPLAIDGWQWRARRIAWNAARPLRLDRPGGYQYSVGFLERLWGPARQQLPGGAVINCFQLYPPSIVNDSRIEKWFFLDQTLLQAFDHYGLRRHIGSRMATEVLAREREGYQRSAGVIVHSDWAAESVRRDYQIDPRKVHVVLPGANVDPMEYRRWEASHGPRQAARGPLKLVFVGKEWQRKGLDRLLRGLRLARAASSCATLRVIGCRRESLPPDLAAVDGVEWYGFIDKRAQPGRFLDAVAECDVGCLLSRAEAGGISLREYHALGLAVLGTEAGGSPQHALPGASVLVPVEADDADVAEILLSIERDTGSLDRMRRTTWDNRHSMLWEATTENILAFWPSSGEAGDPGTS